MRPLALILALLIALPALAEWRELRFTFKPSDCAKCLDSLESRLMRSRGVKAAFVDAEAGRAAIVFDDNNRASLARLRFVIERDGTRIATIEGKARGTVRRIDGVAHFFVTYGDAFRLRAERIPADGPTELEGVIDDDVWTVK